MEQKSLALSVGDLLLFFFLKLSHSRRTKRFRDLSRRSVGCNLTPGPHLTVASFQHTRIKYGLCES